MRQWTSIIREVAGVEHLDTGVLFAVEWGNDGAGLTWLAAEIEWHIGIVKPETEMVLMRWREGRCRPTCRNREGLNIENALYGDAAGSGGVRL